MDACKRRIRHERSPLAKPQSTDQQSTMATVQARACTILVEFGRARTELAGEAVILTNGRAGTVDRLWLDEFHGLRISIRSQEGNWPVSTIKSCGAVGSSGRYAQQSCGGASKSAMGQNATRRPRNVTSVAPPGPDIDERAGHVRLVPTAEATAYSITSSARRSSDNGTSTPSNLAVLRLMTNRNLEGCSMGSSSGFAPFRIRST
jgi:hypothetical protein